jgi:hypothetical protein
MMEPELKDAALRAWDEKWVAFLEGICEQYAEAGKSPKE